MIGLSVSRCIGAMARGEVDPSTVSKIIAGTKAENVSDWEEVMASYKKKYWQGVEEKAEAILHKFISEGRVVQPRLSGGWVPDRDRKIWVESEKEIPWIYT